MDLSIIIPVTRPGHISKCLQSLIDQMDSSLQVEVIVVKSKEIEINKFEEFPTIKIINTSQLHPSIRRNIGAQLATGEYLAFIDDDVCVSNQWLETIKRHLGAIDVMCGPIRQTGFEELKKNIVGQFNQSRLGEGFSDFNCQREQVKFYNVPLCNVVLKKSIWEKVGGFNEFADYNIDDAEFFYLASRLNIRFENIPDLLVDHDLIAFGWDNLKKRAHSRFQTGINSFLFYEIYFQYPALIFLWLTVATAIVLTFMLPMGTLFLIGLTSYSLYTCFLAAALIKKPGNPFLDILIFQVLHAVIAISYFMGCLHLIIHFKKFWPILKLKRERFKNVIGV